MRRSLLRKRAMIPVASLFVIVALLALVQATGLLFPLRGKCPDWMYPTIPDGGQVLAESVTYRYRDPHRGEIVRLHVGKSPGGNVVPDPKMHDRAVSLRVIGVPEDTVVGRKGRVFVNGKKADDIPTSSFPLVHVGRGEYFVLGDNRSYAEDSRSFGLVPRERSSRGSSSSSGRSDGSVCRRTTRTSCPQGRAAASPVEPRRSGVIPEHWPRRATSFVLALGLTPPCGS